MPISLGSHTLSSKVLLAPMAGTSDKPFRHLCRAQGAALTTSEMVLIQDHLLDSNKSKHRLDFAGEVAPISIQIAGSEPEQLAYSAQRAVEFGADIVDINMGCPAKKVCNKAAGSALMQDEQLVAEILTQVVNAVAVPVTLKMRTGWQRDNKNAPSIAHIAEDTGIQMLSVHGRTREDKYAGLAEYDTIGEVKSRINIPVIANGDIDAATKAKQVLDHTGADGVMIGRATQGNPWILFEIDQFLTTGQMPKPVSLTQKKHDILTHITQMHDFYGEKMGAKLARKHIFWYATHLDEKSGPVFWKTINQINDCHVQYQMLEEFLESQ